MYNLNLMANALYLNQPVAETKATEKATTNTNLLKQEAPKDSFEYATEEPKKSVLKTVVENLNPITLFKNVKEGVKNFVAYQLFLKKDEDETPKKENVFTKVADGVKNFVAYHLFLKDIMK